MLESFAITVEIMMRAPISRTYEKDKFTNTSAKLSDFEDKSLLILDDDDPLRVDYQGQWKKRALTKEAKSVAEGLEMVKKSPPNFAVEI